MTEREFYAKLGKRCKELRDNLGISVSDMVKKTGLSRSLLYEFETSGKKISAYRLDKVMQVLGLPSIEEWFDPEKKNELHLTISGSDIVKANGSTLEKLKETLKIFFSPGDIIEEVARKEEEEEELKRSHAPGNHEHEGYQHS